MGAGERAPERAGDRADGGQVTAGTELTATADAAPLAPAQGWPLPDGLLGGLNVASPGLGAVSAGTIDVDEPALFDGVTPDGGGFRVYMGDVGGRLPLDLVVDLAGDEPVPVAGMILNTQAGEGKLSDMARDVELLLSLDGATWESVMRTSLSSLPIDQPFLLAAPVPATHAMLRVHDKQSGERGGYLELGEWKVIATPGVAAGEAPLDLAEPSRGGHVISMAPFSRDEALGSRVLDEDLARDAVAIEDDPAVELVLGFQDGRAALVTGLEWTDPTGSVATERIAQVEVEASMRSPLGPWQPLGTWVLTRGAGGSVSSFDPADPFWARYVRLSGVAPADARQVEFPGRSASWSSRLDDDYRSIVGEWGYRSPAGPYEWLGSAEAIAWTFGDDAGDTPGGGHAPER